MRTDATLEVAANWLLVLGLGVLIGIVAVGAQHKLLDPSVYFDAEPRAIAWRMWLRLAWPWPISIALALFVVSIMLASLASCAAAVNRSLSEKQRRSDGDAGGNDPSGK